MNIWLSIGVIVSLIVSAEASSAAMTTDTSHSGTVTAASTWYTISVANMTRNSMDFVNLSADTCHLYVGSTSPTLSNSIPVPSGAEYIRSDGAIPGDAIQVYCPTALDAYYLGLQ